MKKFIALAVLLASGTANAVQYNMTVLADLGGNTGAYGMNESGQVVGNAYNSSTGVTEAAVWNNGVIVSLGFEGIARDVNNSGTVVGENGTSAVNNNTGNGRAYMWDSTNGYADLGDLNGTYAGAWAINESGVITGNSFTNYEATGLFQMHAFRYEGGVMSDLPPSNAAAGYSRGIGMNDLGTIIGRASVDEFTNSDKYMAQWDPSNTFYHDNPPGNYSSGRDINNNNIAVGIARSGTGTPNRAAIWDASGSVTIFGTFGGERSQFNSINDSGVAVGMAMAAGDIKTAMISLSLIHI